MKRFSSTILLAMTLALPVGLSACSSAPAQISIPAVEFSLPGAFPTLGYVAFPVQAATFQASQLTFNTISLTGNAAASKVDVDINANIYARAVDPSQEPSCQLFQLVNAYICPKTGQVKVSSQPLKLLVGGNKTAFRLEDQNDVLKTAVKAGKLWLGAEIESGAALSPTVKLSELVASLTVF
jgi:hypothetical protein